MQLQFRFLPTAFQCPSRYSKYFGSLILRQAFVEKQVDNLPMFFRESPDAVVELAPLGKVVWFLGSS